MFADITIPADAFSLDLSAQVAYLEDSAHQFGLIDVANRNDWQQHTGASINFGLSPSVWWFRVRLFNPQQAPRRTFLEITETVLDHIEVSLLDNDQRLLNYYISGDKQVFSSRPLATRTFVFPLTLPTTSEVVLYLRIQSDGAIHVPLILRDEHSYWLSERDSAMIDGAFFGMILVMLLYNFVVLLYTRDSGYFYYVVYIAVLLFTVLCYTGYSYQYLWPDWPYLNQVSIVVLTGLTLATAMRFNAEILSLYNKARVLWQISKIIIIALILIVLIAPFAWSYTTSVKLYTSFAVFSVPLMYICGVYLALKKDRIARYYTIAWTPVLLAFFNYALTRIGLSPLNWDGGQLVKLAASLEAILFSLVLAARIQQERDERLQIQQRLQDLQQRSHEELESAVQQRTQDLQSTLEELDKLSLTDSLTETKNRRFFDQQFTYEWQRCRRENSPLSVLLIDIDRFKQFNDNYGHATGDRVLQKTAAIIQSCVHRQVDSVCRYGGEEFVVLMPRTHADGAAVIAERIRASLAGTTITILEQGFAITVSVGVATAEPATMNKTSEKLLEAADKALYKAKREGRNRVCIGTL